jgi:uncharacterized protein YcaQ
VVHELSRTEARRIAVRAQLLDADAEPTGLIDVVRRLTMLQLDYTTAVAPSAELVAWSRLGERCALGDVERAVDHLELVDLRGMARPADDIALYRADMAQWADKPNQKEWEEDVRDWMTANEACRHDILAMLRSDGPLPASEFPDTTVVPWRSSGWNNDRNVGMLLDLMVARGDVASAGRDNGVRLWDLASRIYRDDPAVPSDEAKVIRDERRLAALGIARAKAPEGGSAEPNSVDEAGEPAVIEGVRGRWRVDPSYVGKRFAGRLAILSPLDRLIFERKRMVDLFEFDYQLEMYKPVAKRRWGYWAMPILYGDRLVGKIDAKSDRVAGVLRVYAVHRDIEFSRSMDAKLDRELRALARWLDLELTIEN